MINSTPNVLSNGKQTTNVPLALVQHQEFLARVSSHADAIVAGEADESQHPHLLFLWCEQNGFPISLKVAEQFLAKAKARAIQSSDSDIFKHGGDPLDVSGVRWLWEGMVMPGLNLWFSLPKIGKSSLIVHALAAWAEGATEFLGRSFAGPCPPIVLISTDQGQADWAEIFGTNKIPWWIKSMISAEDQFCLDDAGLALIDREAARLRGAIFVFDSYNSLTAPLGLDENKADVATPLRRLLTILSSHGCTGVVLHHANKGGGTSTSRIRGSSAIAAVPSWYVELSSHRGREQRIFCEGTGRGKPRSMLIQRDETAPFWSLVSEGDEAAQGDAREEMIVSLTDRQMEAYGHIEARSQLGFAVTAAEIASTISCTPPKAHQVITALKRKGLIVRGADLPPGLGGGRPSTSWWITECAPQTDNAHARAGGMSEEGEFGGKTSEASSTLQSSSCFSPSSFLPPNSPPERTPREAGVKTSDEPFPFVPPAPVELLQPDGSWQNGWIVHSDTSRWEVVVEKLGSPLVKRRGLRPSLDVRPCPSTPPESPSAPPEPPSRPWRPGDPGEPPF